MNETLKAMRSDLAFLKALAEDRGPIPAMLGWHLVGIGAVFGIALLHVWTVYSGLTAWPDGLRSLLWLPGVLAYIPVNAIIAFRYRHTALGPTARVFGAAWAAMGIMTIVAVLVLILAQDRTDHPFHMIWPALSLVLYGGAWVLIAMILRKPAPWIIALCCFIAALTCAFLIRDTAQWLVMSACFFALVGAPGIAIVRAARQTGQD